jgi:hypothetical protein
VPLSDALGNPNYVAHFLFLQLDERIEHAEMELMQIRLDVQLHLKNKHILLVSVKKVLPHIRRTYPPVSSRPD